MACMKTIRVLFLAMMLLGASSSHAAEVSKEMKQALHALMLSQNLDKNWPAMTYNAAGTVEAVERGALDALGKVSELTPAQRETMKGILKEMSVQLAADLDDLNRQTDITRLAEDMMLAVYPKYYTLAEVQQQTAFYNTPTFAKLVHAEIASKQESNRTGADQAAIRQRYMAALSAQDARVMLAFSGSDLGRKQQRIGPRFQADCKAFLESHQRAAYDAMIARNASIARQRFLATQ